MVSLAEFQTTGIQLAPTHDQICCMFVRLIPFRWRIEIRRKIQIKWIKKIDASSKNNIKKRSYFIIIIMNMTMISHGLH